MDIEPSQRTDLSSGDRGDGYTTPAGVRSIQTPSEASSVQETEWSGSLGETDGESPSSSPLLREAGITPERAQRIYQQWLAAIRVRMRELGQELGRVGDDWEQTLEIIDELQALNDQRDPVRRMLNFD